MTIKYNWNTQGVIVKLSGDVSIEDINDSTGVLHGDPRIEKCHYTIWDFCSVKNFSVLMDETIEPAAINMVASRYIFKIKIALVTDNPLIVDACKQYIEQGREFIPRWDFEVFSKMEDAHIWAKS